MVYRGISNWPPTWTKSGGALDRAKDILRGAIEPHARIFLVIQFAGSSYMGTLLFQDAVFCRHITAVLQTQVGKTIKEIGVLDLSYTL
jgi:hypothetical protein